jgi:hypothetical protein
MKGIKYLVKGGLEHIIAVVVLTGIIVALIATVVVKNMSGANDLQGVARNKLNGLNADITGDPDAGGTPDPDDEDVDYIGIPDGGGGIHLIIYRKIFGGVI